MRPPAAQTRASFLTVLILIRHGESIFNREQRLTGRVETPLTERGEQQARSAGAMLGDVSELRTSPLGRARQTAQLLGTPHTAEVDNRLIELDFGVFDGMALGEVPHLLWQGYRDDADFAPEGGESLAALHLRVTDLLEELFARDHQGARNPAGDVVVVSHVSPIKAAVLWALGLPPQATHRLHLANASLTKIGWGAHGPVVHAFNIVAP